MTISPYTISARIPSSAGDSFALRTHAFSYMFRIQETNPPRASSPPPQVLTRRVFLLQRSSLIHQAHAARYLAVNWKGMKEPRERSHARG
ncbi:hypothetical protein FIBSPDRAFT_496122 [Athelia psychrophila]|uniref:Uncharacterized protein n=1 Tax=Athelia psychrophila TaxID=1759441 RepID=A0A166KKG9_9AGAM|nr:hypothetical protein FIBSPDRAFT_496122 [Fibularhizoctonia sp. CBS 109695]